MPSAKRSYKIAVALLILVAVGAWIIKPWASASPPLTFAMTQPPPAPGYDDESSWYAYPGKNGLERSIVSGDILMDEATAKADVFFIHPTTYLKNNVYNVPIDAPTTFGDAVLLNQASVFNGCCRIYAPHYRQATLNALTGSPAAVELAYSDVSRAFQWYLAHENHGRPFIIASHSQGSSPCQSPASAADHWYTLTESACGCLCDRRVCAERLCEYRTTRV